MIPTILQKIWYGQHFIFHIWKEKNMEKGRSAMLSSFDVWLKVERKHIACFAR